jgi:alpha-glucoside transport system permease protein
MVDSPSSWAEFIIRTGLVAAFAAYGFAWIEFPGRKVMFIAVVAMLVVPLQIALIPILRDYTALDLNGTFLGVWLAHTGFGLALAVYLLYNYISALPRDILESAFMDGASHFTVFTRLILPLSVPIPRHLRLSVKSVFLSYRHVMHLPFR